jgi:tetratricopeptide (TPR) repeat protein
MVANVLRINADIQGSPQLRDTAEHYCRDALVVCSIGHPSRPMALRILGNILARRAEVSGTASDMDEAVKMQRMALEEAVFVEGPGQYQHMEALGTHLMGRHALFGNEPDLEEAVQVFTAAADLFPPNHFNREFGLNKLSQALRLRFERLGVMQDLDDALIISRRALAAGKPGTAARGYTLDILCQNLALHFQFSSSSDSDIDELVHIGREALKLCPPGHHDHWIRLDALADSLHMHFMWSGLLADLEETIELRRRALDCAPEGDPRRWIIIGSMAKSLCLRFTELGYLGDLDEAINLYRQVPKVSHTGADHHDYLIAMAEAFCLRFRTLRIAEDLEDSASISETVLNSLPPSHSFRPRAIKVLSEVLLLRDCPEDANTAVRLLQEHRRFVPTESSFVPEYLLTLVASLWAEFRFTKRADDAQNAKDELANLLDHLPPGRRDRFQCLTQMAELYLDPAAPFHETNLALQYLADGVADAHRDVRSRLQGTVRVLQIIEAYQRDLPDFMMGSAVQARLLDIYVAVVSLLPQVAYFGVNLPSRLQSLSVGQNAAVLGASYALGLDQAKKAIEILEQGRAVFWTHSLRLRSQFDDVPSQERRELLALARELERKSDILIDMGNERLLEKAISLRRKQSEQFTSLVEHVRSLPGLDRFMLHDQYATIAEVADHGPVVVLVPGVRGSYALVIRSSRDPVNIALPFVTEEWITVSSGAWRSAVTEARSAVRNRLKLQKVGSKPARCSVLGRILQELWTKVVQPVLEVLGFEVRGCP